MNISVKFGNSSGVIDGATSDPDELRRGKPSVADVFSRHGNDAHFAEAARAADPGQDHLHGYRAVGKRLLDVVGSSALIVAFAPLIALVVGVVTLEGGRPIFSHPRVGRGGRVFNCYKIRTMVHDAERRLAEVLRSDPVAASQWARYQKLERDPRVTRLGRFLRRSSLDELPQLWNVLRGDMSLVGPRPVTMTELDRYREAARLYLSVRPGLTGFWQVNGRNGGNERSYAQRIAQDVRYITSISFAQDIKILLATALCVLRMTGR
jgi:lipopolysaccharide/colanic/teichoic acid biosynthesis glycosyltransferase